MIPLRTMGPVGRRRGPRPRLLVALGITLLAVGFLVWPRHSTPTEVEGARVDRSSSSSRSTSTVAASTTVSEVPLDPSWLPKGISRYSDSEQSKAKRDAIGIATTTSTADPRAAAKGATTTTRKGATTTTTRKGGTTTVPRPTTTAHAVAPTAPPTTAAPPTEPPPTSPPTTAPPAPST